MSPKSYAYLPRVSEGQAEGSTATTRKGLGASLRKRAPRYGKQLRTKTAGQIAMASQHEPLRDTNNPAKLDPPPVHPTSTSG